MDARKSAAAVVFLVALSLSFGYLRVQATGDCSVMRTVFTRFIIADDESMDAFCLTHPDDASWEIGSDICNMSGFVPYEPCINITTYACPVRTSDLLQRGPTFVCCQTVCTEFKINPVVNHVTVPPVIQAGKEATIYTTVAAKPLPPDIPSLLVGVRKPSEENDTEINTYTRVIPSPSNDTEYIILHTFVVPSEVEEMTLAITRLELPEGWKFVGAISFEPIGVVTFPDEPPTTEGTSTTTDPAIATSISPTTTATNVAATSTATVLATTTPTTPMTTDDGQSTAGDSTAAGPTTGGLSPGSTCIAAGHLAAAVVISMAVPVIIFTALVCIFCFWYKKRKDLEKSYSNGETKETSKEISHHQTNGVIPTPPRTRLSLPVQPSILTTQNSTTPTPTPIETPMIIDEKAGLLGSSSRNRAAAARNSHITGVENCGYNRIPSRDSASPTTPGETRQPLSMRDSSGEPSAAAAASTKRTEIQGTGLGPNSGTESGSGGSGAHVGLKQGIRGQHEATLDEQEKRHIYEEVKKPGYVPPSQRPLPDIPNSQQEAHNIITKPYHFNGSIDKGQQLLIRNKQLNFHNFMIQASAPPPTTESEADVESLSVDIYHGVHDGITIDLPLQPGAAGAEVTSV